jgi:hypothetical protein
MTSSSSRTRRLLLVPWLALLALYLLLAALLHFRWAAPHFLPVTALLAILLAATLLIVLRGGWRLLRGPRRRDGLRLLTLGTVPLALVVAHVAWGARYPPRERPSVQFSYMERLLLPLVESLMDLEARFRYPHRTPGRHVVMIHAGVADPEGQVEAMDRHIERMEKLIGRQTTGKAHWVRGDLLWMETLCLFGIALGSRPGDRVVEADGLTSLDRHELAHWTINSFFQPYQIVPPKVLVEGWAESQSGYPGSQLYGNAWHAHEADSWLPLSELIATRHANPDAIWNNYSQGGVLADYLLERLGGPGFFDFYHGCTADGFEADCRRVLGEGLDELDAHYRQHLQDTIARRGSLEQWRLVDLRCAPGVDAAKWQAFVPKYAAAVRARGERWTNLRLRLQATSGKRPVSEVSYVLSGRNASRLRRYVGSQQVLVARRGGSCCVYTGPDGQWKNQWPNRRQATNDHEALKEVRHELRQWLAPSMLDSTLWNIFGSSEARVIESREFSEADRPRLRVTIELPGHDTRSPYRETWTLAVDQDYAAIQIETCPGYEPGIARSHFEYEERDGLRFVKRAVTTRSTGTEEVANEFKQEVKELHLEATPDEAFTLASFGVDEKSLNDPPAPPPAPPATAWRETLFYWPLGWAGIALVIGLLLSRRRGEESWPDAKPE